ncbi:MAG: hypothetical protein KAX60_06725 [Azonexus sp.]|nr:hypothetical protein [Azonexus sp.]
MAGTLWRLWQLLTRRLPARRACRWLRIGMTLLHAGLAGWLLYMAARCIWPYACGEGFAAGWAAGAVGVMAALWTLFWLISEGLMLLCRTERGTARTH